MKKVILDCDPGMDDSIAMIMAAKAQNIELLGVTTVAGNYPIEVTTQNALKVLELIKNEDLKIYQGMGKPIMRALPFDPFSHGDDGQANNNLPEPTLKKEKKSAVDFIVEQIRKHPNEVTIICTGPLTNLGSALIAYPELKTKIKEVVAISGSFGITKYAYEKATGDTPQSEWNVYVDPEAADVVYNSGVKFTAIGLDIAAHFDVDFTSEQLTTLKNSKNPEAKFLSTAIEFTKGRGYGAYTTIIDALAVAHVIDENLVETIQGKVGIETGGKYSFGNTVWDRRDHHSWEDMTMINIGAKVNYKKFLEMIIENIAEENING